MLIQQLWDSFYSSFASGGQGCVVPSAAKPKQAETKTVTTIDDDLLVTDPADEEINMLAKALGGIHRGQKIELTLQELLQYVPQKRRRSDAYTRLKRELRNRYDVTLEICTSNSKNNAKQ